MSKTDTHRYRFELQGQLGDWIEEWFDDMTFHHEGSRTILEGQIIDSSHLHGILNRIRDLNLELLSLYQVSSDPDTAGENAHKLIF